MMLLWGEYSRLPLWQPRHALLRDTSQLIRDVMDRPQLAQRTDSAQPSPTSINGTLVNPEKAKGLGGVRTHVWYF